MTVHLVGVGPGDAELMTLRAVRLLGEAEAVVHDRLIGDEVLSHVSPTAERYDVGKTPGVAGPTQDEINELLVQLGRRLGCVVRVKGGDPCVFGRGAEEADACHAAGVPAEVVPGISSSIAAPSAGGVSLTRRGVSSGFCVVTAHQDPGSTDVDWGSPARCGLTVVVLMGAARAAQIRERLTAGGMAPGTPVAVVTDATSDGQRTNRTTLDRLGEEPVRSPSVIVVGAVADAELSTLAADHLVDRLLRSPSGDRRAI
ncbi:MAG: uroporphyrinogen-III C-methyltransferase [Microthrixaceae bacterium]